MSDPFYVNRGEIKHLISRLDEKVQKLTNQTSLPTSPTFKQDSHADPTLDQSLVQDVLRTITELENQLKDLTDTFAIQSTNAKKLGIPGDELEKRKNIVEQHQREFDRLKENFARAVKGQDGNINSIITEFYAQRNSSVRRFEVADKENYGYSKRHSVILESDPMMPVYEPSRVSMHEMKKKYEISEDDDDLVEIYEKKGTAVIQMEQGKPRQPGWMERHFPLSNRRNRIIFFSFPVVLVVIIIVIIVTVSLTKKE